MSTVVIRDKYLAQLYREAYARHVEGQRLGLEQERREQMFPSTSKIEGGRGAGSPLGTGFAKPAAEKEPQR